MSQIPCLYPDTPSIYDTLHFHLDEVLETLSLPLHTDPINICPASTRAIITTNPASLIKLAHSKIHSYAFSNVPVCWRRLFTDASIYEAVRIIRAEVGCLKNGRSARCDSVKEAATGKRKMTEDIHNRADKGLDEDYEGVRDGDDHEEDWIQKVVRLLDMAVIMCGAPQREGMIETLLLALQQFFEEQQNLEQRSPRKKRQRTSDVFPTDLENAPLLQHPISKCPSVSMAVFEKHLRNVQPLVIQDALAHWPALHIRSWKSRRYLMERTFGGRRLVPVEVGRSYTDEGWGQKIVPFKDFMEQYLQGEFSDNVEKSGIGYLAQHDLFAQVPSLRNDISVPDFCYTEPPVPASGTPLASKPLQPKLDEPLLNAWFGPAGTVSPLHTDPYHNILCQVVGKKYVRLYSPLETDKLYPRGVEGGGIDMSNTSEVDVGGGRDEQDTIFPLFQGAKYVETILCEGECLYIPVGWWHYVKSLTVSFSVSFWWN